MSLSVDGLFSTAARGMRFSAIRRMSALIEKPGIISFAPGQPSPDTFPVESFRSIIEDILTREGPAAFQYTLTRGVGTLIAAVREYARAKGVEASSAETIVVEGSQMGLDLVSRVLLDPGDAVLVELPSYIGATSAFRAVQAHMVGVRLDEEGLDLEDLRRQHRQQLAAGRKVKFLYVIPSFQNPSGVSHSLDRRRGLMELARELDLLILEDDPYGDLYFEDEPRPTLKSMDAEGRVLYLSSFSKILAPGLRTAFLIGPEEILAKVEIAKQSENLCGSSLDQRIILECLKRGLIEEQKSRIRPYYRQKRDIMLEALAAEMPPGVRWTKPAGGLFVWATLPEGLDAEKLLEAAVAEGVAYVAGAPFFVDGSGANTLRLTFAKEAPATLAEGVKRLAKAVKTSLVDAGAATA
ncbi:MAG TPA: PLP-dependent aminotransferase family protein [Vicinamibacteria bacterium]|nr:PLP-dependent aminotransferase family protein [Vicinamibacteria bacterium]